MAYRIYNPYKESHIMDLNLMGIHEFKRTRVSAAEIGLTLAPLCLMAIIVIAAVFPEMVFFAECQNIPGGDICSITVK